MYVNRPTSISLEGRERRGESLLVRGHEAREFLEPVPRRLRCRDISVSVFPCRSMLWRARTLPERPRVPCEQTPWSPVTLSLAPSAGPASHDRCALLSPSSASHSGRSESGHRAPCTTRRARPSRPSDSPRALSTWCRQRASPPRGRTPSLVQQAHVTVSHSPQACVRSTRW